MRTLKRRETALQWLKPTIVTGGLGSVTVEWTGTPQTVRGTVQPMSGASQGASSVAARVEYGERADRMRLVIVPNGEYETGHGIWLQGEDSTEPPWLVVSVSPWQDLTVLTIEKRA